MKRTAFGAVFVGMFVFASAVTAQTPVRMAWQDFAKDPKRVASFRKAVAVMRSRSTADPKSADYRGSWEYWGAMHGYFGTTSPTGTKEAWMARYGYSPSSPYWQNVKNLTPPDSIATTVWAQCQHGTPYFFPWHRLYLYYFERVLQKAAGDPNLRLPYWDYTDTANLAMPKEFTQPTYVDAGGATVANPLYEARRAPGWSSGSKLDGTVTNINRALNLPYFLGSGQFQSTIEGRPHGDVHCAVAPCKNTVMGAVPYSSNDPIFWLHHCNIDRMWDCWHSISGHDNPNDPNYLKQPFSYVDENGNLVTKTVNDIINGGMVDYVYQRPSNCARAGAPLLAAKKAPEGATMSAAEFDKARLALSRSVVLGTAKGVAINALTMRKSVALPENAETRSPKKLALSAAPPLPVETDLVLKDIKFDLPPDTTYEVYVESKSAPAKRVLVGSLNFFTTTDNTLPDQVFNVTDVLRALGKAGKLDQVSVVFEASTGRTGAHEAATFNAKAHLVVGEVDFVVRSQPEK
jgi:hypothetical protein